MSLNVYQLSQHTAPGYTYFLCILSPDAMASNSGLGTIISWSNGFLTVFWKAEEASVPYVKLSIAIVGRTSSSLTLFNRSRWISSRKRLQKKFKRDFWTYKRYTSISTTLLPMHLCNAKTHHFIYSFLMIIDAQLSSQNGFMELADAFKQ